MQVYTNILTRFFFFLLFKTPTLCISLLIILVKVAAVHCQISDTSYTYFYTESGQHNITQPKERKKDYLFLCLFVFFQFCKKDEMLIGRREKVWEIFYQIKGLYQNNSQITVQQGKKMVQTQLHI